MKKTIKASKKGFTLVELIVVLVILAVLAAMLVPALVGYIDKAKAEKEYQTAATIYTAAQATVTEMYGRGAISESGSLTQSTTKDSVKWGSQVITLAGVGNGVVEEFSFKYNERFIITSGSVKISGSEYTLTGADSTPSWSAAKTTSEG